MAEVLTPPFLLAALVLCVAGAAKLRSPAAAGRALRVLGLPGGATPVRALAVAELVLGLGCAIDPGRIGATVMGCVFGAFAVVALLLARERAACGCFGEGDAPASSLQSGLSAALALVALAGAARAPHGLGWVADRSPSQVAVLAVGIAASVFATVLAYTELPRAWSAWSAR
jgi:hypothetical protein